MNEEKNIELRSESVQEILGRPPRRIIRWGISIIFAVVAGLVVGSYFFKYPDILTATITVTTENLPAGLVAKTTGKIDTLFVKEKQRVKKGDFIALIENPARFEDVMELSGRVNEWTSRQVGENACSPVHLFTRLLTLGELQTPYQQFLKAFSDYQYFIRADFHHKKIKVIEKQIYTQNLILQKSKNQLNLSREQLEAARQIFTIDSNLFEKKVLSHADYQNAKNAYLQHLQAYENAKVGIDNQNMSILQLEQSIFELQQQQSEQRNQLEQNLSSAQNQLQTQIKTWEQNYLLISPIEGIVTFTKYWQKNQNMNTGETLATVVPTEQTKIIGKIELPPRGAGKVKEGQYVNVKFDNYPYLEYGMVKVQISHISLVPIEKENQKYVVLEVVFPDSLVTNYGKTLEFTQEMTGTAEIITEDLRLLDKFLNPVRAVLKNYLQLLPPIIISSITLIADKSVFLQFEIFLF